jgi:hypothetical protein
LLVDVDAEAADAGLGVGEVDLTLFLQRDDVVLGHHRHGGLLGICAGHAGKLGSTEVARGAHARRRSGLYV